MTHHVPDPMSDDRMDRELRRFMEGDVERIAGAPTQSDMVDRVARATHAGRAEGGLASGTPTFRLVVVLGLLAALMAGVVAAGALWNRSKPLTPLGPRVLMSVAGTGADGSDLQFTVELPERWSHEVYWADNFSGPTADSAFFASVVDNTFEDPCGQVSRSPGIGRSVDDVMAALGSIPGTTATTPVATTLGRYDAFQIEIMIPASLPCAPEAFYLWQDSPDADWWATELNEVIRVTLVEVAGYNVAIAARLFQRTSEAARAELARVLDTIVFDAPSRIEVSGAISPGTYEVADRTLTRTPFHLAVPPGWSFDGGWISKGNIELDGVTFSPYVVTHVYTDSCPGLAFIEVGTPELLVAALTEAVGHEISTPTATTLGGLPATRLELHLPEGFCSQRFAHVWPDPGPAVDGGLGLLPGQTATVYVVDDGGVASVILAIRNDASRDEDIAELEAMVSSVRFLP